MILHPNRAAGAGDYRMALMRFGHPRHQRLSIVELIGGLPFLQRRRTRIAERGSSLSLIFVKVDNGRTVSINKLVYVGPV